MAAVTKNASSQKKGGNGEHSRSGRHSKPRNLQSLQTTAAGIPHHNTAILTVKKKGAKDSTDKTDRHKADLR